MSNHPTLQIYQPHFELFSEQYPLSILIAEDDQINQKRATKIFNKLGYHTQLSINGKMAVDMAIAHRFDIIFMDVQMPEVDGLEATKLIRNIAIHQP